MGRQKTNEEYQKELASKRDDLINTEPYIRSDVKINHLFLKCGHEYKITPGQALSGTGCGVCHGLVVVPGVNSFDVVYPELLKYFVDPDAARYVTAVSGQRLDFKCPVDGCSFTKTMRVADLSWYGFSCPIHSDGVSFPEKLMCGVLEQIGINFRHNKALPWSCGKRYDFIIDEKNLLIETHGLQHYEECFIRLGGKTLQEEQENDRLKAELATANNMELIVVDCRESNFDYIKNNILHSKLSFMFDLSNIDWQIIEKNTTSSFFRQAVDLWNDGARVHEIAHIIGVDPNTIRKYLLKASDAGLCQYTPEESHMRCGKFFTGNNHAKSRPVCLCDVYGHPLILWESRHLAAEELDIPLECIRLCAIGKIKHANNLLWRDLDKIIKDETMSQEPFTQINRNNFSSAEVIEIIKHNRFYPNSVVCYDDNLQILYVWETPAMAEKQTGITHILDVCYGKTEHAGGLRWLYVFDQYKNDKIYAGAMSRGLITYEQSLELIDTTK